MSQVAEQMGRNRLPRRCERGAVLLAEPAADQAVQRLVERPHLLPEPIELGAKRIRGEVVRGPPAIAGIDIAKLNGPGVRDLDEPLVAGPHRGRQRASLVPEIEQPVGVAQLGDRPLQRRPVETILAGAGTVRAGGECALQLRQDVRQLAPARRPAGRDGRRRGLQPRELARGRFRQVQPVEARGAPGQLRRRGLQRRGGFRGQRFRIAGKEVLLHPGGACRGAPQREQALLGGADEGLGFRRRRSGHRRRARGECRSQEARQHRRPRSGHRRTGARAPSQRSTGESSRTMVSPRSEPVEMMEIGAPLSVSSRAR